MVSLTISAVLLLLGLQTSKHVVLCNPISVKISIQNDVNAAIDSTLDDKSSLRVENKLGNDKNCKCTNFSSELCKCNKLAKNPQSKSIFNTNLFFMSVLILARLMSRSTSNKIFVKNFVCLIR